MAALEGMFSAFIEHGPGLFVGVTIVLAGGLLWARAQRTAAARRRLGIWTALAAGLYLLVAATPLPRLIAPPVAAEEVALPNLAGTLPPGTTRADIDEALGLTARPTPSPVTTHTSDPATIQPAPAGDAIDWSSALAAVYLGSATLLLLHHLLGFVRLCCIVRRSRRAHESRLAGVQLPANVRLLFANRAVRPFCAGWLRPVIVMSPELEARPDLFAAVLRHEAAHLHARDPLVQTMFAVLALPLALHPLFWWLRADVRFQSELLADERAAGNQRTDYARELLDLADDPQPAVRAASTVAIFHRPSAFYRRIQMLLQPMTPSRQPLSRIRRAGQLVTMLALVATTAGVFGVPAAAQDPARRRALAAERQELRAQIDALTAQIAAMRAQIAQNTQGQPPRVRLPDPVRAAPDRLLPGAGTLPPESESPPEPEAVPPPPEVVNDVPILSGIPTIGDLFTHRVPGAGTPAAGLPGAHSSNPVAAMTSTSSVEGIVALASRLLDLETEIEVARSKFAETKALADSKMVSKGELQREQARLRNLERKRKIVRGLVDGEMKATKTEIEWLERAHKQSNKTQRLRIQMQIQRAEGRLDALRAAR